MAKPKGPDGWCPKELEKLPKAWTNQLATFYNQWEARGHWPPAIRRAVIALIAKQGANTEAQLRPIGILSYIYRIWMAIRKQDTKQWSLRFQGGLTPGRPRWPAKPERRWNWQPGEGNLRSWPC